MIVTKLAIALALAGFTVAGVQTYQMRAIASERAADRLELKACGARLANLVEDLESDNAIDNLPDGALTAVPDRWLRPEGN